MRGTHAKRLTSLDAGYNPDVQEQVNFNPSDCKCARKFLSNDEKKKKEKKKRKSNIVFAK